MFIRTATVISAALCLLISQGLPQTAGRSTVSGFVFGPRKTPVPRIYVELRNEVNGVVGRVRTDDSGRYYISGVGSGRYSLTVLPSGTNFEEQTQEIEISGINARGLPVPENVQKDFYLLSKRNTEEGSGQILFAQEIPKEAKKAYERAVSDLDDKKTDKGIEELAQAIAIFPDYFLALERLGLEYLKQHNYKEARKTYGECVRVNQRSYSCLFGLGSSAFSLREDQVAVELLQRAVEIDKGSSTAFFMLGVAQRRLKLYAEAERYLLRAKELDGGKTSDINWNLALLYGNDLKKYAAAADELELYLKASPNVPNEESIRKLIKRFREQAAATP